MAMPFEPFLQSITPRGLLSFGPDTAPLELRPLNVLIGPNGSGKSNLIDVIRLVRSLPTDLQEPSPEWVWEAPRIPGILREPVTPSLELTWGKDLVHRLELSFNGYAPSAPLRLCAETIRKGDGLLYHADSDGFRLAPSNGDAAYASYTTYNEQHRRGQSILTAINNYSFQDYPFGLHLMYYQYTGIRIYADWGFGREAAVRNAKRDDNLGFLSEDYSNLGPFIEKFGKFPVHKNKVIEGLRELYPRFTNYEVVRDSISFTEGDISIPAARLSDGTLRYLCLLAILYNPNPTLEPPLVCLEEPELGLHPDIVSGLAKHLLAASERMQLIVTTHSDILIDALSDTPESIVVFENEDGSTRMNRLDANELKVWLEKYGLGQLWTRGQIGGNR